MGHRKRTHLRPAVLVAALALIAAACGGGGGDTEPEGGAATTGAGAPTATETAPAAPATDGEATGTAGEAAVIADTFDLSGSSFTVGSKEFTEQIILGQIALQALEAAGAEVSDQTGLVGTNTVREALTSGEIDTYWEYTGTAWVNFLGETAEDVPDDLFEQVAQRDLEENGVHWLEPAPLNNTYAMATTTQFAQENGLETLSDMAAFIQENPDQGSVCAASEFINRPDGLPGLEEAYGFQFSEVVELELSLIYATLPQGSDCVFGEVFATDARIVANDLTVLEDDQDFFVPYNVALTLRQEVFEENEQVAELFAPISETLTDEAILELNALVDVEGGTYEEAARTFLTDNGFVTE